MSRIIPILMKRDNISKEDARTLLEDVREQVQDCIACGGSYDEVEEIVASELGLEMDYIDELL